MRDKKDRLNIIKDELSKYDYSTGMNVLPINEFRRSKSGNCIDYVNYLHLLLSKAHIRHICALYIGANSDGEVNCHTFVIVEDKDINNNNPTWVEFAWKANMGMWSHSIEDVISLLVKEYKPKKYRVVLYDPYSISAGGVETYDDYINAIMRYGKQYFSN